ncbi:hypothetical protein WMY93_005460 [Mugilogobius chulae]|uniref:DDE Tnp4 domain-containing protein n=1 Tax=Mugilogobius chulae TaxID=88201 RepID=A0AAW0PHY4_9GOBI
MHVLWVFWMLRGTQNQTIGSALIPGCLQSICNSCRHTVKVDTAILYPAPNVLDDIGQGFARLARHNVFEKVAGAIDGCRGICDSERRYLNELKNSPVYYNAEYPPPGYFLLGDGGYPCIESPITLITPFK